MLKSRTLTDLEHISEKGKKGQFLQHVCTLSRFSHVRLSATLWTVAFQVPLSMGFSRQEYQVGCHAHLQGDLPVNPVSPMSPALAGRLPLVPHGKPHFFTTLTEFRSLRL